MSPSLRVTRLAGLCLLSAILAQAVCFGARTLRDEQTIDLLQHQLAVMVAWFCDGGKEIYWAH